MGSWKKASSRTRWLGLLVLAVLGQSAAAQAAQSPEPAVIELSVTGVIDSLTADYVERGLAQAEATGSPLVLLLLDTPGGLDTSMRRMAQAILNARVPTAVLVYPAGSRAASAGAFIGMAAHVLALASGTTLGAAHPVDLQGESASEKITQDAAAYMRALAVQRGRNDSAAARMVTESLAWTAAEAVEQRVADVQSDTPAALLAWLDGRSVVVQGKTRRLATAGISRLPVRMNPLQRFLHRLANPNLVYVLLLIGVYGLIYELASPGAMVPGVIGAISLLLAILGLEALPVSLVGLLLLSLGAGLLVLEIFIVSHGILTVGGLAALVLGSVLVFPSAAPGFHITGSILWTMLGLSVAYAALFLIVVWRLRRGRPQSGTEALVGLQGVVKSRESEAWLVHVQGEDWLADAEDSDLTPGQGVVVTGVQGLRLRVRPAPKNQG